LEAHEFLVIEKGDERQVQQVLHTQMTKKGGNDKKSKKNGKGKLKI